MQIFQIHTLLLTEIWLVDAFITSLQPNFKKIITFKINQWIKTTGAAVTSSILRNNHGNVWISRQSAIRKDHRDLRIDVCACRQVQQLEAIK
jgi:hypothetical protein